MKRYHRSVFSYPTRSTACRTARIVSKDSGRYMYVFEEEDRFHFDTRYDPDSKPNPLGTS